MRRVTGRMQEEETECKKYYGLESRRALEEEEEKGPKYEKHTKIVQLELLKNDDAKHIY